MLIGVIAGLVGLSFGIFGVLAFRMSEQQRKLVDVEFDEPALPPGAAEVLAVVGRAFVVVDAIDGVVRASPAAYAFGLVRGHTVVHAQLLDMTARVRRDGVILEKQFELPRGPLGQGTIIVQVRAAMLGEEYILLLADDRTEITRTEEIRNDFVANVSHELKTPVGAISLLAEALESSADDEVAVRRFAKRMEKESGAARGTGAGHHRAFPAAGRQRGPAGAPRGHQFRDHRRRGPFAAARRKQEHLRLLSAATWTPWFSATRTCWSRHCAT